MHADSHITESGFKRAGRLLLAVCSFAGAFVVVSQTMLQFGTVLSEANASGLICALATMSYVMHLPPRS